MGLRVRQELSEFYVSKLNRLDFSTIVAAAKKQKSEA